MNPDDKVGRNQASESGIGGWVAAIIAICVLWLAAMVAASYFGFESKNPVRIENWKPGRGAS